MPVKIIIDDNKGLYQQYDASSGGAAGIKQSRASSGSADGTGVITSGAITIPANSLITAIHTVVTSNITGTAGNNIGIKAGTTAGGNDIAISANMSTVANATVARKQGQSTNSELSTALRASAALVITAGQAYLADETDLHITATISDAAFTAGALQFTVEFITFE